MTEIRVLFLGTADFAVPSLKAAHEDEHFQVVKVISQPDRPAGRKLELQKSPVKETALSLGIDVFCPEKIMQKEVLEEIKAYRADVAIVIAYGQILPQAFLDLFPYGVVNVHGSLLPRWRGAAPIQRAIMAGDKQSGVCLQKVVKALDAGDVLACRKVDIPDDMTADVLYEILKQKASELIHIELMDYIRGNLSGSKQDEEQVTYAKKILKSEGLIDWQKTNEEIWNQYRALKIWPGIWTTSKGKKLKLHNIEKMPGKGEPGEVLSKDSSSFVVACGKGAMKIYEVQPESKAKMSVEAYKNGFGLPEKLGD